MVTFKIQEVICIRTLVTNQLMLHLVCLSLWNVNENSQYHRNMKLTNFSKIHTINRYKPLFTRKAWVWDYIGLPVWNSSIFICRELKKKCFKIVTPWKNKIFISQNRFTRNSTCYTQNHKTGIFLHLRKKNLQKIRKIFIASKVEKKKLTRGVL